MGSASRARFVTGTAPLARTTSRSVSRSRSGPGHSPAGERSVERLRHLGPRVHERGRACGQRLVAVHGMRLAAGIADEEVAAAVAVVVRHGDAHSRVRIGHAGACRALVEPETEPRRVRVRAARPGDVLVHLVRVGVVGDVQVEVTVAIEIGEDGSQPVPEPRRLDAGVHPDLPERDATLVARPVGDEEEVANARIRVREPLRRSLDRSVEVGIARDEQVRPAVAVHVADRRSGVPPEIVDPGGLGALGERTVAVVPEERTRARRRDIQVRPTVEVEICSDAPVAPNCEVGAGTRAHVRERPVHVVEQAAAREAALLLPAIRLALGVGIDDVEVEPAVVVVVDPAEPPAHHRHRVVRHAEPERALPERQPGLARDVLKSQRGKLGCAGPVGPGVRRKGARTRVAHHRHDGGAGHDRQGGDREYSR